MRLTLASPLAVAVVLSGALIGDQGCVVRAVQAPREGSRNGSAPPAQMEARLFARMEESFGKKLTAAQKQQLRQAFKERQAGHAAVEMKFRGRLAKTLGLTPQQFQDKVRQMQGKH